MRSLKTLSDKELLNQLTKLVKQELDLTLEILPHLIEVEHRKIYRSLGYRSMFVYCTEGLGYSESSACRRIYAARAIRKCPRAYVDLREGRVNLGTLALVWQHLTPELLEEIGGRSYRQVQAIVSRFNPSMKHRDRTRPVTVQRPVAVTGERQPAGTTSRGSVDSTDFTDSAGSTGPRDPGGLIFAAEPESRPELGDISHRRGGKYSATEVQADSTTETQRDSAVDVQDDSVIEVQPVRGDTMTGTDSPAPSANTIELETVKMHQVNCLVDDAVMQMLDRCKELLSGKYPRGIDYNTLMMEMATDWLEKHDPVRRLERRERLQKRVKRERCGRREHPERRDKQNENGSPSTTKAPGTDTREPGLSTRAPGPSPRVSGTSCRKEPSRYISPATRDSVYSRDKGRCTFVGSNGRRCGSKWDVEIHHDETPYAMGGGHSIHNLRLLCASHNMLDAERVYGRGHMGKYYRQ